ncbi:MAG: succinylglutamate desuccinylase/aspartoacylase family protein [Phycisphaerales bacterium]|nr:succinylglutamate desuccinylase/aspartoacylase family protein [Phycisphaerales bacterium]
MIQADDRPAATDAVSRFIGDVSGGEAGPTLVVIGGLHANEPAGIEAAQRVHKRIEDGDVGLHAGRLVSLRGNLRALGVEASTPWLRERYIDEDLNRAFLLEPGPAPNGSAEQHERNELSGHLKSIKDCTSGGVFVLDLHTVSSESPAFIALEDSLPARRFAARFPLPKILGLEEELQGLLIDYATNALGCVSCICEAGLHDDPRSADVHEAIMLLALAALGMSGRSPQTSSGESALEVVSQAAAGRQDHFYDVRQRVEIGAMPFEMRLGAAAFMSVAAERTVLASENGRELKASANGLLFLPNRQPSPRVGDDAFFVIARVGSIWLTLSAWLRRRRAMHAILPMLFPGVRRRKDEPHTIVVAPEYAAILRRELLHLFGYRLVRWTHTPYMPWHARVRGVVLGVVRSVFGVLRFALRGGEQAALPNERPTDWIARRHALDLLPSDVHDLGETSHDQD